jgi:hypothetical protein
MADAPHQFGGDEAADDKACRPGRAEQAERGRGITFEVAADGEQDALQAIAHEEEKRSEKQRGDGQQISSHFQILGKFDLKNHKTRRCPPCPNGVDYGSECRYGMKKCCVRAE